jgi:hypothetical protein
MDYDDVTSALIEDATEPFGLPPEDQASGVGEDVIDSLLWTRRRLLDERIRAKTRFDHVIEQLTLRRDGLLADIDENVERIESITKRWHAARIAEGAAATIRLPGGTLASRKAQVAWIIDRGPFLLWAKAERPELLRQPPIPEKEPDRAMVKAALRPREDGTVIDPTTGAVVPGVTTQEGGYLGRHYEIK